MPWKRRWARFDRAFGVRDPVPTGKRVYIPPPRKKKRKPRAEKLWPTRAIPPPKRARKNARKPSLRRTKAYLLWRRKILQQFNYTCSFCGSKERLELDHIEPVSKRPDLIMTDENARILCKPCHQTTPSYPLSLRTINK